MNYHLIIFNSSQTNFIRHLQLAIIFNLLLLWFIFVWLLKEIKYGVYIYIFDDIGAFNSF